MNGAWETYQESTNSFQFVPKHSHHYFCYKKSSHNLNLMQCYKVGAHIHVLQFFLVSLYLSKMKCDTSQWCVCVAMMLIFILDTFLCTANFWFELRPVLLCIHTNQLSSLFPIQTMSCGFLSFVLIHHFPRIRKN